jgi:peptide-methionine (S)-S-oxide reductase
MVMAFFKGAVVLAILLLVVCIAIFPRQDFTPPPHFPVFDAGPAGEGALKADTPELATFGSGCFWCTEAVFQQLNGVLKVVSGYSGGDVKNPTYEQVSSGICGHAEVVQVTYDPKVISYAELLEVFWQSHDPTTRDRQGHDVGSQYRSIIFCHTSDQQKLAELYKRQIEEAKVFDSPLVTEIMPFTEFFPAEDYHQNFYNRNRNQGYCRIVIGPKLEKLKSVFQGKLKSK